MTDLNFVRQIDQFRRRMRHLGGQVPFAASKAINATAKDIQKATEDRMGRVFQRVSPFTRKAVGISFSRKSNLNAEVFIKDRRATYLRKHEVGGGRDLERFEYRLRSAGVLQPGEYVTKAEGARINRGTYTQVLSQLKALREGSATNSRRSKRTRRRSGTIFVSGSKGIGAGAGLPRGIWRRKGITIQPLFWIVTGAPQYQRRLGFKNTARTIARKNFTKRLNEEFTHALRTAFRGRR